MNTPMSAPTDEDFMREALALAARAAAEGEVPVGAVVVRGAEVIGRATTGRFRAATLPRTPRWVHCGMLRSTQATTVWAGACCT